jgi:hypothetical protein
LGVSLALGLLCDSTPASAEDVVVPVSLQAELLAKVAAYDRNFASRAGNHVEVLILVKRGDAQSGRVGGQLQNALDGIGDFAGIGHSESIGVFTNAADLAAACKNKKIAVVYLTPGFDDDIGGIAGALNGTSVLTVSAVPGYVPKGIVLGFDSVSGKSKLLVNLTQARLQSVSFKSEILKLMKVFE